AAYIKRLSERGLVRVFVLVEEREVERVAGLRVWRAHGGVWHENDLVPAGLRFRLAKHAAHPDKLAASVRHAHEEAVGVQRVFFGQVNFERNLTMRHPVLRIRSADWKG